MAIELRTPSALELDGVLAVLREWQRDGAALQLHPGDVGWFWRFGAEATAAAVRTWSRDGAILAVGMLDGADQLRLALAPSAQRDHELARSLTADAGSPERGVLGSGEVVVEAPRGSLVRDRLVAAGWVAAESWTPLRRDLTDPVAPPAVRIAVVGLAQSRERAAVQRASFERSTFTDDRWRAMADGPAYADARCLVAYDELGVPVAAATVWSAGLGRPGLLEPLGVHRDQRGRGHGTAISLAAAAALREMGASSAVVCTPSSNVGAVATYRSAGFEELPAVPDLGRDAVRAGAAP